MTASEPTTTSARSERFAVTAAYAAQGLGYASLVTALPAFKDRYSIGDDTVALVTLTVVLAAAAGSWIADLLAIRWGSRVALIAGLAAEAVTLAFIALPVPFAPFWVACAIFGVGLGAVDAASAMQGVIVQRRLGFPVMGSFFAAWTAATIVAALAMSGGSVTALGASLALGLAAVVAISVASVGTRRFNPLRERTEDSHGPGRPPLPRAGIWVFGFVIFAAFTLDSTVATWSSVYLSDDLDASKAVSPLGYALYSACMLAARLVTDAAVRHIGRVRLAVAAASLAAMGALLVGSLPVTAGAVIGFALAGAGVGALVPIAFSGAGDLEPKRGDEIIARVNLFNYAGALVGAVLPGVLSGVIGLHWAFVIAACAVAPVALAAKRFDFRRAPDPASA